MTGRQNPAGRLFAPLLHVPAACPGTPPCTTADTTRPPAGPLPTNLLPTNLLPATLKATRPVRPAAASAPTHHPAGHLRPADQAGQHDPPRIPLVQGRAGRAHRRPPVVAVDMYHPARQIRTGERPAQLPGGDVHMIDVAGQADRMGTAAGRQHRRRRDFHGFPCSWAGHDQPAGSAGQARRPRRTRKGSEKTGRAGLPAATPEAGMSRPHRRPPDLHLGAICPQEAYADRCGGLLSRSAVGRPIAGCAVKACTAITSAPATAHGAVLQAHSATAKARYRRQKTPHQPARMAHTGRRYTCRSTDHLSQDFTEAHRPARHILKAATRTALRAKSGFFPALSRTRPGQHQSRRTNPGRIPDRKKHQPRPREAQGRQNAFPAQAWRRPRTLPRADEEGPGPPVYKGPTACRPGRIRRSSRPAADRPGDGRAGEPPRPCA